MMNEASIQSLVLQFKMGTNADVAILKLQTLGKWLLNMHDSKRNNVNSNPKLILTN